MSTSHTLTFEGCNYLRHRIILSLLSSRPIKISQIRSRDDKPGLWESEASLIRLIDRLTNGSKIEINETGTRLLFSPGLLQGGTVEHECSKARSISYYLEVLIAIAPFCATSLDVVLKGVTSSTKIDPSVDHIIHSLVPLLKRRNLSTTLKVVKRGCAPKGGGEVHFTCSILSSLNADQWIKCGKVKRVRGVCYCCRVSPAVAHRAVEAAKGILLKFLPDVYIAIDQRKGASAGLSPGYGVVLVAETTEGSTYVGESIFSEDSTAEAVGIDAAKNLLQEVVQGGVCNSNAQYLPLLQMAVSQRDVSKVLLGSLTPFTIEFLRHLKTFFNLLFKIETISNEENEQTDIDQSKFMLTCVGVGYSNISKRRL